LNHCIEFCFCKIIGSQIFVIHDVINFYHKFIQRIYSIKETKSTLQLRIIKSFDLTCCFFIKLSAFFSSSKFIPRYQISYGAVIRRSIFENGNHEVLNAFFVFSFCQIVFGFIVCTNIFENTADKISIGHCRKLHCICNVIFKENFIYHNTQIVDILVILLSILSCSSKSCACCAVLLSHSTCKFSNLIFNKSLQISCRNDVGILFGSNLFDQFVFIPELRENIVISLQENAHIALRSLYYRFVSAYVRVVSDTNLVCAVYGIHLISVTLCRIVNGFYNLNVGINCCKRFDNRINKCVKINFGTGTYIGQHRDFAAERSYLGISNRIFNYTDITGFLQNCLTFCALNEFHKFGNCSGSIGSGNKLHGINGKFIFSICFCNFCHEIFNVCFSHSVDISVLIGRRSTVYRSDIFIIINVDFFQCVCQSSAFQNGTENIVKRGFFHIEVQERRNSGIKVCCLVVIPCIERKTAFGVGITHVNVTCETVIHLIVFVQSLNDEFTGFFAFHFNKTVVCISGVIAVVSNTVLENVLCFGIGGKHFNDFKCSVFVGSVIRHCEHTVKDRIGLNERILNNLYIVIIAVFFFNISVAFDYVDSEIFSAFNDITGGIIFLHKSNMSLILRDGEKVLNKEIGTFRSIITIDRIIVGTDCKVAFHVLINTERIGFCCQRSNGSVICFYISKEFFKIGIIVNIIDIEAVTVIVSICNRLINHNVRVFCKKIVVGNCFDIARHCLKLIKECGVDILSELGELFIKFFLNGKQIALCFEFFVHFLAVDHKNINRGLSRGIYGFDLTVFINGCLFCGINFAGCHRGSDNSGYLVSPFVIFFLVTGFAQKFLRIVGFLYRKRIKLCDSRKLDGCLVCFRNSLIDFFHVLFSRNKSQLNFRLVTGFCKLVQGFFNKIDGFLRCCLFSNADQIDCCRQISCVRGRVCRFIVAAACKKHRKHDKTQT